MRLVLSLFSGVGSLDEGFRRAGFCVVSAGDVAFSSLYDVRHFHPPAGVFDGVIGGDPCQSHSALANLVRAKGLEPSFPDMTPEFERVVKEARPRWFLRENVPGAPDIKPDGYDVRTFLLDHSTLDSGDGTGHEQMRRRRFWFGRSSDCDGCGWRAAECDRDPRPCCPDCSHKREAPELRAFIDFALWVLPETQAVTGDSRAVPIAIGGSEKPKIRQPAPVGNGLTPAQRDRRKNAVTGRHDGVVGAVGGRGGTDTRYSLDEMLELQKLPLDIFDHSPLTVQGKRKLIGNAVPLPMAEALGRAVREATRGSHA